MFLELENFNNDLFEFSLRLGDISVKHQTCSIDWKEQPVADYWKEGKEQGNDL